MRQYLEIVNGGDDLSREEMAEAMRFIMDGHAHNDEITDFLLALSNKGETVDEITGAAMVLREKAKGISAPDHAVDCCGTGGDQSGTYNISTAVALVAASCGVTIAKHGNRAASSKSGAADVLEAMGVNLDAPTETLESALRTCNFAFLMAPQHHEAMKNVRAARQKIKQRTMFNLLGPLANPAGTKFQLIGVYDPKWLRPLAEVLKNLGTTSAWLVHGRDGLDEITTTTTTDIVKLSPDGNITEETLTPSDFGLPVSDARDLTGGDAQENAEALMNILRGKKNAYRDIVIANAAAVLCLHDQNFTLKDAAQIASAAIDQGKSLDTLEQYISLTGGT